MTDTEKLELAFYKNGSAKSVLSRFNFTKDEEQLIHAAIRTAKMQKPRMSLIHKADELLKEVAKTREPIIPKEKAQVDPHAMAKLGLMQLDSASMEIRQAEKESGRSFFGFKSKYGVVFVVMVAVVMIATQYFQTKPINDKMQRLEQLRNGNSSYR